MDKTVLYQLAEGLQKLGEGLGFSNRVIRTSCGVSEIYVVNRHALQLEVDWRENDLFMYAVYLENNSLPDKGALYHYGDGHWCRKYLEEIYQVKRPIIKDHDKRYSSAYLLDCFAFYADLINSNTDILKIFGVTGNIVDPF
jgi:hypothetical protein